MAKQVTIGLIGNPNCGKTTLFNGLTGANQHIGNWPGVTVERKEGAFALPSGRAATLVDLPGIYSLTATSEDEKASLEYLLSRQADLYINVLDATTLERNLYLTLLLCELKVPMVVVVSMMDIARQRRTLIDLAHLAEHLGVPVIGVNATEPRDVKKLLALLETSLAAGKVPHVPLEYPNELEQEIDILASASVKTAQALHVAPRWVAIKALEGDPVITKALSDYHDMAPEVLAGAVARCASVLKEEPDIVLADSRYGIIAGLVKDVVTVTQSKVYLSEKIDRFVINRFLGIPLFLGMMFLVFWFTQCVGGAFVPLCEGVGDTCFASGSAYLLGLCGAPDWLVAIVSHGAGAALQTVMTFIPPVGFMFLALSVLEDSGYMARAAFLMDRFMRWLGLPGKSFVPMLVGFGCTVPAVMATRTLESRRDRLLNVFMIPFMSCGAKLPIWVLFAAAFFPQNPGRFVALMYGTGIVLGIATGLLLKRTLFQGEPSHFIMELPPYHMPRPKHILLHTWERLRVFIVRAGKLIVPMVLVLGVLNTVGTDGRLASAQTGDTMLAAVGRRITPVFEPIGVARENWPAAVAVFSGLFAKESVIGTLKGVYGQMDAAEADTVSAPKADAPYSFLGGLKAAIATVPRHLAALFGGETEEAPADDSACASLAKHFPGGFHQVFSYLLFILLYVPCLAATGTVFHEVGRFYGCVFVGYLTVLGWSVATIYHAVTVTNSALWFCVGTGLIGAMFAAFWAYGRRHRAELA